MASETWSCPDWAELDRIWRHPLPFVLWPVGDEPLLSHWMDDAVRRGVESLVLVVSDRPSEIREHFQRHQRWSRPVEIRVLSAGESPPPGAVMLRGLPGMPDSDSPRTAEELIGHWVRMNLHWLESRRADEQHIDRPVAGGGWIGPGAQVHPSCRLHPPFRIGAGCRIAAGCSIGPRALVGDRCIVGAHTEIRDSIVLADTWIGERTLWQDRVADGGVVIDPRRGLRIDLHDDLVSGKMADGDEGPGVAARILAGLLWLVLAPLAAIGGGKTIPHGVHLPGAVSIPLATRSRGPLLLRRHAWLREIAAGRMRWIGPLPRGPADLEDVPTETAERLRQARPGLLALSDLHGCHRASDPLEWPHAAMQVLAASPSMSWMILRRAGILLRSPGAWE